MLTLSDSVRLDRFTIFRDAEYAGPTRQLSSTFYVLPDAPELALDSDGGAAFRFWWYRRSLVVNATAGSDATRAGGLLMVTVNLGPTSEERSKLEQDLASRFQIVGGADAVTLAPISFTSGTVALAFAGESGGQADFVHSIAGNGPAKLVGNEQAAFAVDLTRDGAALLASAIDSQQAVLHVRYDLVFDYHLDDVKLRVWCDARLAQSAAAAQALAGPLDPAALRSRLVASQAAGIEIGSETPLPADRQASLQQLGQQLLDAALAATVISADGKSVRPYDTAVVGTLNHTFSASFAASQHAVAEAILALPLTDSTRASRMLVVDLAAEPQPIDVTVLCPIDFAKGPIAAVHCFISYASTAADFVFKAGAGRFAFHALASGDERHYRWRADVVYTDGSSASLPETVDDDPLLILALDGLGVLEVDISLGDVPLDVVSHVVVDLEYPPRQLTHQVVLDGANAHDTWQSIVGAAPAGSFRWRPTFLTMDGRRVSGEWRSDGATRVIVDAPPGLAASATVQVVAAGDFTGVAQLVVELATASDATPSALNFTAAGQTAQWTPRLSQGAPLAYRARTTAIGQDGTSTISGWTDESSPLLVVRDQSRFTVTFVSRLLDIGGAWSAATVALEHVDAAAGLDERDTLVLRDDNDGTWSFRLGSSGQHSYRYQLTLVPKGGTRVIGPWQEADDEVLVLRLPSA